MNEPLAVREAPVKYQVVLETQHVRPGYKQTEVGVIPEDWDVKALGGISSIYRGASPRPIDSPMWFDEKSHIGWVRISDVTKSKTRLQETTQKLSEQGVRHSRYVPRGSLIMSICATVGRPIVTDIDVCIHDGFVVFEKPQVSQPFLYHVLKALESSWSKSGQTGSQMNLNTGIINPTKIPLPPTKAEQEVIAEALSDADALIESLEQLIAKKLHLKQGTMQELLTGKKRLPGFNGEWAVMRLGDVADPNQKWSFTGGPFGSNLKSSDYTDDGVRIIQLQNIGDGEFHNDSAVFTSPEKADELLSCNIYPGEIILSKMGDPVARACIIPPHHERYLMCSDGIRLAVNPKRFNTYFVYISINAPDFRTRAENAGTGSTRKRIGLTELRNLELLCPELFEQTAIATCLSDMDTDIAALETQLAKTRSLKQGMMHNLLTGKIRLV